MGTNLDRRELLKLAVLFVAATRFGRSFAMDAAPEPPVAGSNSPGVGSFSDVNDQENEWSLGRSSNFKAIFGTAQLKEAFLLFLVNVYHIYPEDRFQRLIEEVSTTENTDKEIYHRIQERMPEIKPILSGVRYALPALAKQKAEMKRQTLELLGSVRKVNGYMEIGTTGRYVGELQYDVELKGDVVLVHSVAPSYSLTDVAERGQLGKIGRFVSLNDYAPILPSDVADQSLDLVTNFIGFHHSPPSSRDGFVESIHRVLRLGGRLVVRDHDVTSNDMNRMVALAHDVFNMGLGTDWSVNQKEIRNFTSISQLVAYLEGFGFKAEKQPLLQPGDPTHNALMEFIRV